MILLGVRNVLNAFIDVSVDNIRRLNDVHYSMRSNKLTIKMQQNIYPLCSLNLSVLIIQNLESAFFIQMLQMKLF